MRQQRRLLDVGRARNQRAAVNIGCGDKAPDM
jgi:hypothetical protein